MPILSFSMVSSQCKPPRIAAMLLPCYVRQSSTNSGEQRVHIVAGVDLGGTAVNYTLSMGKKSS